MILRLRMSTPTDFSRDPASKDSTPDHCGCDDSKHCGPGSSHPTLTASAIPDSVFFTQVADESRSSGPQRNRSALYGPSPFRGPARDVFHLSPIHRGAVDVQQRSYEWRPPVEYPDPALTSSPVQPDPSYGFVASGLPWDNGVRNPSAAGSLLPNVGGSPSPINIQILSWPHGVLACGPFTSYPNSVSGETSFPQNNGPLIQSHHPPHHTGRLGPPVEYALLNDIQLSRSGSQGPPLNNLSTFESGRHNSDPSFSPTTRMYLVPQRPYSKAGDRWKHKSIIFKVNGCLGIPARDAIGRIYAGLEGRDDQVLVDKRSVMMLRLEWPGYPSWSRKIRLNDWKKTPQRIRLEKLATEAAKCIDRFIQEAHAGNDPDRECSDWRVGPEFIGTDRLVLVALERVSRGSWQPRIGLLSR